MLGVAIIAGITVPAMDQQHMMHLVCWVFACGRLHNGSMLVCLPFLTTSWSGSTYLSCHTATTAFLGQ